ncbi:hypothetical protein FRC10_003928 [Ceratobasidium sp. 414]|nr:hypothetical protein FRC10_003928 [Ceratobasidium sp. 414]
MSSSSKPPNPSASTPTPATSLKRKSNSLAESNYVGLNTRHPLVGQDWYGRTKTVTPRRAGSTQYAKESSGNADSASRASKTSKFCTTDATYSRTSATPLATATAPEEREMDRLLEAEMDGAIFCDPNFVGNLLTIDPTRLQAVLEACKDDLDALRFQEHITRERQLYKPIRWALNVIKQAVDHVPDSDQLNGFIDVSVEPIQSHYDDIAGIKPDLVLFDGPTRHWETVMMPIEVKRQGTYLKTGMKQYARAVFAHQLHQHHLYGLAICKWEVTFVEEFRKAFAGLMMLDAESIGYDTAFTTRVRRNGRPEYYVDLPTEAFPASEVPAAAANNIGADAIAGPSNVSSVTPNRPTRRLRVPSRVSQSLLDEVSGLNPSFKL